MTTTKDAEGERRRVEYDEMNDEQAKDEIQVMNAIVSESRLDADDFKIIQWALTKQLHVQNMMGRSDSPVHCEWCASILGVISKLPRQSIEPAKEDEAK